MTNKTKNTGFTLIETLVAVLILASAIAGPLTIASKGLTAANVAKSQTTAQFLAQDALEYVRFVRDSNRLAGNSDWLARLRVGGCVSADGSAACVVDTLADTITTCGGTICPTFVYQGGAASIFTRTISIQTPVGANDCVGTNGCEAIVKVVVSWKDNINAVTGHQVVVLENILNWQ